MPTEKQSLEALEKDTVDTARWMIDDPKEAKYLMEVAEGKLYGLAVPQADGTLRAFHVTDDPGPAIEILKTQGDFYAREGDLCGGLYVSTVPHFWEGRSNKKWDFLGKMSSEARGTLYQEIYDKLVDQINSGYITQSEFEIAQRDVAMAMTGDFWQVLTIVANQPYNINIQKLAKDLGLATPFEPHYVPVDFVGRYLEFNTSRAIEANEALLLLKHGSLEGLSRLDLCNMLMDYGWDGVYTKAGMGTNPELVIWSGDKIVRFGDYAVGGAELSGRIPEAFWVTDPEKKSRFEAQVEASRRSARIIDHKLPFEFVGLKLHDLRALRAVVNRMMDGETTFVVDRFEAAPLYGSFRIIDLKDAERSSFQGMSAEDLGDLHKLLPPLIAAMPS